MCDTFFLFAPRFSSLPYSPRSFNQLDLPEYTSYEQLQKMLLIAITEGTEGFGFA